MKKKETGISAAGLSMMALGTVIGGSFFLGSSIAIKSAGPAVIISYILGGILVYFILFALSEMTVADAAPGSFRTFSQRAFGPAAGFVVGWVYWTGLVLAMSSEATAVSIFISSWIPQLSVPVLGMVIIIIITLSNLLGAKRLSKLESGLAAVKLLAISGFILTALVLVSGLIPGRPALGAGELRYEPLFPGGIKGIAGSMLIVMFTYAGFEIIGLAASETDNPNRTVPRAITYTVIALVGLYTTAITLVLPLVPTAGLNEEASPMVIALSSKGLSWAAGIINFVLVTAILSTMLAATFGLGRMMRSLAAEGHTPAFLKDKGDIPYKGIIFSGLSMMLGLGLSFFLPKSIYIFLVSSGGFSLLFTYLVILATHYKFRRKNGCPPIGNCQLPWYPYSSWLSLGSVVVIILSMPFIPGQGTGLLAGVALLLFYIICYLLFRRR